MTTSLCPAYLWSLLSIVWVLELETKVAEDYPKFYNHGEDLLLVESTY